MASAEKKGKDELKDQQVNQHVVLSLSEAKVWPTRKLNPKGRGYRLTKMYPV
jgi:hypothetical protein